MSELTEHAKAKLQEELEQFKGEKKEQAVKKAVYETLSGFCNEEFFAQAVWDSAKTLSDCCEAIMQKTGSSISDLDAYKAAVKFYLPEADVKFKMEITMGATPEKENANSGSGEKIISLLDLL